MGTFNTHQLLLMEHLLCTGLCARGWILVLRPAALPPRAGCLPWGHCGAPSLHGSPGASALPVLCWTGAEDSDLLLSDEMEGEANSREVRLWAPFALWGCQRVCLGKGWGGTGGARGSQGHLPEEACDFVVWLTLRKAEGKGEAIPGANKEVERL